MKQQSYKKNIGSLTSLLNESYFYSNCSNIGVGSILNISCYNSTNKENVEILYNLEIVDMKRYYQQNMCKILGDILECELDESYEPKQNYSEIFYHINKMCNYEDEIVFNMFIVPIPIYNSDELKHYKPIDDIKAFTSYRGLSSSASDIEWEFNNLMDYFKDIKYYKGVKDKQQTLINLEERVERQIRSILETISDLSYTDYNYFIQKINNSKFYLKFIIKMEYV